MPAKRQYITTAIDYPNAAPHMGHVLEKVLADVLARWFRLRGDEVRFQIGTDEHGVKIQETAKKQGIAPRELVDRNVPLFESLYQRLHISSDVFIRTTDQARHWPTVRALWEKLLKAGALEKRTYTGLYCQGCERFLTKKELVDGKCPIHKTKPEEVKEENWFFLLQREEKWLHDLLTRKNGYAIVPPFRAAETLSLIEQGLEDVSFSRPRSSLSWGIPVPGDEEQTMYVWCDALTNYISGLGYFTKQEEKEWWEGAEVTHVIGKDIARFHALIWPAMLKHAGLPVPPPQKLLIHGFLTSEGEKMSKSTGNVVDPEEVLEKFGVDALRFYLSHEIPVGNDGDFSWKRFGELYDAKLRNTLGNLLNRVLVLFKKGENAIVDTHGHYLGLEMHVYWNDYLLVMNGLDHVHLGLQGAMKLAESGNEYIDRVKVWGLKDGDRQTALSALAELLRHITLMLLPLLPETAQKMATQLNLPYASELLSKEFVITDDMKKWGGGPKEKNWKGIGEPSILFPPRST